MKYWLGGNRPDVIIAFNSLRNRHISLLCIYVFYITVSLICQCEYLENLQKRIAFWVVFKLVNASVLAPGLLNPSLIKRPVHILEESILLRPITLSYA